MDDGTMNIGTVSDHFSIAMQHIRIALSMLLPAWRKPNELQNLHLRSLRNALGPTAPETTLQALVAKHGGDITSAIKEYYDRAEKDDAIGSADGPNTATMLHTRYHLIILPTDAWKEAWDVFVLVLIMYSAVFVPYRICFSAPAEGLLSLFEELLTVAFIFDVVFNFNTAFLDAGADDSGQAWVVDRGRIAKRYLGGWFWIDLPSSLPIELIEALVQGTPSE